MLNKVYIFRIDDKDYLVTASVVEAQEYFDKLKNNYGLELVQAKDRSHTLTYDFKYTP